MADAADYVTNFWEHTTVRDLTPWTFWSKADQIDVSDDEMEAFVHGKLKPARRREIVDRYTAVKEALLRAVPPSEMRS